MIYHWLGDKNFRTGVSNYLRKYELKAASTEDLWDSLEEVSGNEKFNIKKLPVRKLGEQWTSQINFPLVSVELIAPTKIKISQTSVCPQNKKDSEDQIWMIPLTISVNETVQKILLEQKTIEMTVPENAIINLNKNVTAFIRTKYDKDLFERLISENGKKLLNSHDFRQLQSDFFFLANNLNDYAKDYNLGDYMTFVLKYFAGGQGDSIPFDSGVYCEIFSNLEKISPIITKLGLSDIQTKLLEKFYQSLIADLDVEGSFKNGDIFSPLKDLSTQSSFDKELLRKILLSKAIGSGNQEFIMRASELFNDNGKSNITADPKLEPVILQGYLKAGDNLQNLIDSYSKIDINLQSKVENYRRAIVGQLSDPTLLDDIINNFIFNKDLVGTSERAYSLMLAPNCVKNSEFDNYFGNYFLPNFMKITEEFRSTQFLYKGIINSNISLVCDAGQLQSFQKIVEENQIKECANAIKQACEDARNNILVIEQQGEEIKRSLVNF